MSPLRPVAPLTKRATTNCSSTSSTRKHPIVSLVKPKKIMPLLSQRRRWCSPDSQEGTQESTFPLPGIPSTVTLVYNKTAIVALGNGTITILGSRPPGTERESFLSKGRGFVSFKTTATDTLYKRLRRRKGEGKHYSFWRWGNGYSQGK